jgi:uncharacterized membrane protein
MTLAQRDLISHLLKSTFLASPLNSVDFALGVIAVTISFIVWAFAVLSIASRLIGKYFT